MIRIAVLEADIIDVSLQPDYVGYGRMFQVLFDRLSVPVTCDVFNVTQGVYPQQPQDYDALLVSGSRADAFSSLPWIERLKTFLLARYQAKQPLLGICFGHQLLALICGAPVGRSPRGWGLGCSRYQLAPVLPDFISAPNGCFSLLASHQDQVAELPEQAYLLASNAHCPIAAFYIPQRMLCFQGHPEFTQDYARALMTLRQSIYAAPLYARAMDSLQYDHDGSQVARWMIDFIRSAAS